VTGTHADLALMLLADGRLPVGAHTQSAGLEPALLGGLDPGDVPAYLRTRLHTVTAVEAGTAVVARHACVEGLRLDAVQAAWAARTPSEVARAASTAVGRGSLRLMRRLWPDATATHALADLRAPARSVALGAMGAAGGLSAGQVAALVCYEELQTVGAAALKLCPLDPADATRWVLEAAPVVDDVVAMVSWLTDPDRIPATSAPLLESWQHRHPDQPRRLFSA